LRTAFIANIGMRDVFLDDNQLAVGAIRDESKKILDAYDQYHQRLSTPILTPGIEHVLRELGKSGRIDLVLLFASDQPRSKDESKNDTLYFGQILERILPERYGNRLGRVECRLISINPANYDHASKFFAENLRPQLPQDIEQVWLSLTGGIPACNSGLLLNAIRFYEHACQAIYVNPASPDHAPDRVQVLDIHRTILGDFAREEAKAHLRRRDFAALHDTLQRARIGDRWLRPLCFYAERRLHFDFQGAQEALDEALKNAPGADVRAKINRCQTSLQPLMNKVTPPNAKTDPQWADWLALQAANVGELYFNLRLEVQREQWVDFLGRLYRLHEAALRLMYERHEDKRCPSNKNTKTLREWLEARAKNDVTYVPQLDCCLNIEKLKQIRHETIVAHGYMGISKSELEKPLAPLSIQAFVDGPMRAYLAHSHIGAVVAPSDDPLLSVVECLEKALAT